MWMKYLKPYRKEAVMGFFFKLIEAFFELIVPIVVADIIDYGILHQDQQYILQRGLLLLALALLGYACALVCQYFASKTSQGFGTYLRNDMFKAIHAYDYEDIDEIGIPSLMTRITNDTNQLQLAVAMTIRLASRSPFLILGSLVMAFRISVPIALIFICAAPLLALAIYGVMSKSLPLYLKIQKQLDHVSLICRENLAGIRVIRAFSKQKQEKERFQQATQKQKDMQIQVGKLSALLNPSTSVIVNCAILVILYAGGLQVNAGYLTQGEVIALINYMNQILLSMFAFANVIVIYNKATACYKRVQEVLAIQPAIQDGKCLIDNQEGPLVTFDHVSFSYQGSHALHDISFSIHQGETIGIIGGTGSGKSTLIHLIPRFYEATQGQIYIKNRPIQDYSLFSLRQMIGLVPQQATLFTGTIKENICLAKENASDDEVKQALHLAQASFVDEWKDGIYSHITQGGHNLSGGQKQRLTIARALVRNPELLILDDSASALDFATDAALRKAIATLPQTTIIVSQRVSAIMHADKILVLSHGELVGMGKHDELMKTCEIYQQIVTSQMSKEVA
ncbi:ABC transporter ATP-binding protein [Massilimicrobiota timonensis]|uniref:ABC transporter ATP-binding protein n=1 Tax=Massilimicrobiota timonensis TaxID=1776392 RepID=A0ABT7UHA2_9FIRM|nr:ABC transporter ATP-binding protein [Massilimicrobiota timonensis]MDM8195317.1 ABC transporter ATP-binding protein [Massilimicrobiota timonensis]